MKVITKHIDIDTREPFKFIIVLFLAFFMTALFIYNLYLIFFQGKILGFYGNTYSVIDRPLAFSLHIPLWLIFGYMPLTIWVPLIKILLKQKK